MISFLCYVYAFRSFGVCVRLTDCFVSNLVVAYAAVWSFRAQSLVVLYLMSGLFVRWVRRTQRYCSYIVLDLVDLSEPFESWSFSIKYIVHDPKDSYSIRTHFYHSFDPIGAGRFISWVQDFFLFRIA